MAKTTQNNPTRPYGTVSFRRDENTGELIVSFASANGLVGLETHELDIPHAELAVREAAKAQGLDPQNILVIH